MIFIASDHAGYSLKSVLVNRLKSENQPVSDLGPFSEESVDYPDFAVDLCKNVLETNGATGILLCGSGVGMSIAANRFKGIRAALAWNTEIAVLSRQHNNSNVLVLPARFVSHEEAVSMVSAWIGTAFEGGRHERRVQKLDVGT